MPSKRINAWIFHTLQRLTGARIKHFGDIDLGQGFVLSAGICHFTLIRATVKISSTLDEQFRANHLSIAVLDAWLRHLAKETRWNGKKGWVRLNVSHYCTYHEKTLFLKAFSEIQNYSLSPSHSLSIMLAKMLEKSRLTSQIKGYFDIPDQNRTIIFFNN